MKSFGLGSYAISGGVAFALLAGCGGSQPPIGAPGAMPQGLMRSEAGRHLDYKATAPLVFVVNLGNQNVTVYRATAKNPSPLATISEGLSLPGGACIDGQGTLYVANDPGSGGWVSEYPLGKTTPSRIITDGIDIPGYCAIDGEGNLWVSNIYGANATEYLKGSKKPHTVITKGLVYPVGIAIDRSGNLYVGNGVGASEQNVEVYTPGSKSPSRTITNGVTSPAGLAVDSDGTLYVANVNQNTVAEYRSGQDYPFQTITESMFYPAGVTFDKKGTLYVANAYWSRSAGSAANEFALGSLKPLKRQISKSLFEPFGVAYYPALLP